MSVGLLIVTHNRIGAELLETANRMLGQCPLPVHVMEVPPYCDPDFLVAHARRRLEVLDQGDGVLVLTDMFGSTPSNIAAHLERDAQVRVVNGVNLPMLVRVLNYSRLSLAELVDKAVSGGHDGVFCWHSQGSRTPEKIS